MVMPSAPLRGVLSIRRIDVYKRQALVHGSPWSGKTPCDRNESCPIAAVVRLSQAPHNRIRRLRPIESIGALLPSAPPAFARDRCV